MLDSLQSFCICLVTFLLHLQVLASTCKWIDVPFRQSRWDNSCCLIYFVYKGNIYWEEVRRLNIWLSSSSHVFLGKYRQSGLRSCYTGTLQTLLVEKFIWHTPVKVDLASLVGNCFTHYPKASNFIHLISGFHWVWAHHAQLNHTNILTSLHVYRNQQNLIDDDHFESAVHYCFHHLLRSLQ